MAVPREVETSNQEEKKQQAAGEGSAIASVDEKDDDDLGDQPGAQQQALDLELSRINQEELEHAQAALA